MSLTFYRKQPESSDIKSVDILREGKKTPVTQSPLWTHDTTSPFNVTKPGKLNI